MRVITFALVELTIITLTAKVGITQDISSTTDVFADTIRRIKPIVSIPTIRTGYTGNSGHHKNHSMRGEEHPSKSVYTVASAVLSPRQT